MTMAIFIWALGLSVSIFIGSLVVKVINLGLRCYIGAKESRNKLTPAMGCIERGIYTLLYCSNMPNRYEFIVILFGLLAAQKIVSLTKIDKDKNSDDRFGLYKEIIERINVYFISSLFSLCFGIFGGIIIRYLK